VELDGITGKFHSGFEREAAGTDHLEVKLSGVALREERESEEKNAEVEKRAHNWMGEYLCYQLGDAKLSYQGNRWWARFFPP
jgi:hypothetical protein